MRMNVRRILLAWMLGVVVVGPTVAAENPSAKPVIGSASPQAVTGRPLSVLFVGNSYTFYNDLPRMVRQMSLDAAQPRPLDVRDVTFGGASLEAHWNRGVVQGAGQPALGLRGDPGLQHHAGGQPRRPAPTCA